jgi:UDP-glucuronate decarboxylase
MPAPSSGRPSPRRWHHQPARSGKRLQIPILLASTSEIYGDPQVHPQTEEHWGHVNPIGRRSCYDEGKRCAETLFFDYGWQYRLPIRVARISNAYGPRMHPQDGRVISTFIVQALKGEDVTIYGDGLQTRSFCFVDDLVDGLVRLMESAPGAGGPVNLGNPQEFTIAQLAQLVIELSGSSSRVAHCPLPSDDPRQRRPDIARARQLLDWQPKVCLREGLLRTIAYFEDGLTRWRRQPRSRAVRRPAPLTASLQPDAAV